MQSFVRMTKLPNISGRAGYISNPDKQEEIVLQSEAVDWQPYVEYELANQKTDKKNNQGRELVIALYNEWYHLPPDELREKVQTIVEAAVGKNTDLQWAVHWNKTRTNFHVHVIFSERTKEEMKRWDRDIYHTADGKVAKRKADRAKDADGNDLPPVHRKGDLQGGFSAKDTKYKQKGWLQDTKEAVLQQYKEWGVQLDEQGILHQYHEGKGSESAQIKEKNTAIKINNKLYKSYEQRFPANIVSQIPAKMKDAAAAGKVLFVYQKDGAYRASLYSPEQYRDILDKSREFKAKKAQEAALWQRYRETRDNTWQTFSAAQDKIITSLKIKYEFKKDLIEQFSIETDKGSRLMPRDILERGGYFEKRDSLNEEINKDKQELASLRQYQAVAKGHQKIAQSLLNAGADEPTVTAAINAYDEALKLLDRYTREGDFEGRSLKVAQFSLEQAQKRADRILQKLEEAEVTKTMAAVETQYQTFKREEPVLDKAEPPMQQRQLSLTDQIKNADKKQHSMADWNRLIAERNRTGQQQQQPKQQQKKKKDWERD